MPQENTQYGLKNNLVATGIEALVTNNLYKIKLEHSKSKRQLYLFILLISDDVIRFHYSFHDNFNINEPNSHLEFNNFDIEPIINAFDYTIKTKNLTIEIEPQPLAIRIYNHKGVLLSEDEAGLGFWSAELDHDNKTEVRCYKRYQDSKSPPIIYGLGDKTGALNRWGRRFRNAPLDALGYDSANSDPLYKDIPFFIYLERETKTAHGIFFDNFYPKFFDFGRERKPSPYYYFGAENGELNYYFFNGPKISDVVSQYLELTGKPPLVPSFSLGYIASGMSYTENYGEQENQDQRLLEAFQRFQDQDIPATAFMLSSGYTLNEENERHQFIWNQSKFPNPKEFNQQAKKLGVQLSANLKPVLLSSHPWYKEAADKGLFIKGKDDKALVVDYWGGPGSYMDFTNPDTQSWWKSKVKENLLDQGIRGIWNDNNEYEIFSPHQSEGHEIEMSLIMAKLAYEVSLEHNSKIAPWVISRSGYSGIQKYAQTWTGDNRSSWQSLQYDNPILASLGLAGLVHCGCDIGGFWGDSPDPELLLRWIQNGVFTPRFCIHSYKPEPTEPDMYAKSHPEHFKIIQRYMNLRNQLITYLEDAAIEASHKGVPIMRPTVYDFQHDPNTYEQSFEYMFGDKFLVAPIYKPLAESKTREIYLPKIIHGNNLWTNYFGSEQYQGGQTISVEIDLENIPVFKKS